MSGDVSDYSVKMITGTLLFLEKIEIVATYFFAGNGPASNIKTRDLKSGWWLKAF